MSSDKLPDIEKLNDCNWPVWKLQMTAYFQARELWKLITGEEKAPEVIGENATPEVVQNYEKQTSIYAVKCARIKSIMLQMVSTSQIHIIAKQDLSSPRQMWSELVGTFDRPSLSNKLDLLTRLLDVRMIAGHSVDDYFKDLLDITERLSALNSNVDKDLQVAILLRGLSNDYASLRTAYVAKGEVTIAELREALKTEERRLLSNGSDREKNCEPTVLYASARRQQYTQGKKPWIRPVGPCFRCGEMGHIKMNCSYRPTTSVPQTGHHAKQMTHNNVDNDGNGLFAVVHGAHYAKSIASDVWIVDSGASRHMTHNAEALSDYEQFKVAEPVILGNGSRCDAKGCGTVVLKFIAGDSVKEFIIKNVLYVPQLAHNFYSVSAAVSNGCNVVFTNSECVIRNSNGEAIAKGVKEGKLYQLKTTCTSHVCDFADAQIDLWHRRLGHASSQRLKEAVGKDMVKGVATFKGKQLSFCESCVMAKQHRKSFTSKDEIESKNHLDLVHTDVCGPMSLQSFGGAKYFITFIDDYSRCCQVYFMKHKSEALEKFKLFEAAATNECGTTIKAIRSDNGGEYISEEFKAYLRTNGIAHDPTIPYTPEQNGVAERMNRTLQEMAIAQISHAGLSNQFWAEAVRTAAFIRNRMPVSLLNVTPFERWYGKKPNLKNMKVFGCAAYALNPAQLRKKFDPKSTKLRFIGYEKGSHGYRLWNPTKRTLLVRRDVIFNENDFCITAGSSKVSAPADVEKSDESEAEDNGDVTEIGQQDSVPGDVERTRPVRARREPKRFGEWHTEEDEIADNAEVVNVARYEPTHFLYFASGITEPKTIDEASNSAHARDWKKAADEEFSSLTAMNTWELVELPKNREVIGCRWVFKVKEKDGVVQKFKARLVAKGYSQQFGVDYHDTFAPVVRFNSLRTLLALAVQRGMIIHQMDVVTAFLNGYLDEDIYMEQPPGYVKPGTENMVCHLKRSLYGLKQSPRCWNILLCEFLLELGFRQCKTDNCVFIMNDPFIMLCVYVDDLVLMATCDRDMSDLKEKLCQRFKMSDLGLIHHILGITVIETDGAMLLSQQSYIEKVVTKFNMNDAKHVATPADVNVVLCKDDGISKPVDAKLFQSLIGSLLFAAIATRPDIQLAVGIVSRYCSQPNQSHLTAAKRILRYLSGTASVGLRYVKSGSVLTGYCDSDFARDVDDRRSTTGYLFIQSGSPISWSTSKQKSVAVSTSESEYLALSNAVREALFLLQLFNELNADVAPVKINCDNQAVISMTKNPSHHSKSKHIDVRCHFVREAVVNNKVYVTYCPTGEMLADVFTKPLPKVQFEYLCQSMGLC